MKILTSNEIREEIKKCKPTKIAVAYIGKDWENFLTKKITDKLEYIILSPTEGSNPEAIGKLVDTISWDKVLFCSNLHSKVFVGAKQAVCGSANLSHHALDDDGNDNLLEFDTSFKLFDKKGYKTKNAKKLDEILDQWKSLAKEQFPTKESKIKQLKQLWEIHNNRKIHRQASILRKAIKQPDFFSINFDNETFQPFYLTWYQGNGGEYTQKTNEKYKESDICNSMAFHEKDDIHSGLWCLSWEITLKSRCSIAKGHVQWIFFHDIIPKGYNDGEKNIYSKVGIELTSRQKGTPPFEITDNFINAFNNFLDEENDLSKICTQLAEDKEGHGYRQDKVNKKLTEILKEIQKRKPV